MPSSRYYSTPMGEGMSNLANAIGSMGARDDQEGLLAARQRLIDAQIASQQGELEAQQALAEQRRAAAELDRNKLRNYRGMSGVFTDPSYHDSEAITPGSSRTLLSPTSLLNTTSVLPPATGVADAIAGGAPPTGMVPGVGAVPGAATVAPGGMPSAIVPSMANEPPPLLRRPAPEPPMPTTRPGTGIVTSLLPGGRTGVNRAMMRDLAAGAVGSGMDPAKALLMFAAGNEGTEMHTPDESISYFASGAGEPFAQTIRGGTESLAQKAAADAAEVAQRAAAARAATAATREVGLARVAAEERVGHERNDVQRNRPAGGGRGGGAGSAAPKLSAQEERMMGTDVMEEAAKQGLGELSPKQKNAVMGDIRGRVWGGQDLADATADVLAEMVEPATQAEEGDMFNDPKPATFKLADKYANPTADDEPIRGPQRGQAAAPSSGLGASAPAGAAPKTTVIKPGQKLTAEQIDSLPPPPPLAKATEGSIYKGAKGPMIKRNGRWEFFQ